MARKKKPPVHDASGRLSPGRRTDSGTAGPRLGVVMIVKNEEKNIGTVLSDISGVADEIVVVDTGSTDRTVEILESHGVTVGHFAWCDDFSAARNASIDLASADYLLWLDADDRIDPEQAEALLRLKAALPGEKNRACMLRLVNTAENHQDTVSFQLRIFPRLDGVRFTGRIHEQVITSLESVPGMRIETEDITIRHTGYHSDDDVIAKGRRNLAIQLKELEDGNDTARQHFYIAMSCHAIRDYAKCLDYIREARARSVSENWYKYSFNLATECCVKLGHIEEALAEAQNSVDLFPGSGKMHYNLGAVLMKAGRHGDAIRELKDAARLGVEVDAFPTPPNIGATLHHYLGLCLERTGRMKEATEAYRKSLGNNPVWAPALKSLGLALVREGRIDEALSYLEKARAEMPEFDPSLWMSLARVYLYGKRWPEAHALYRDTARKMPANRDALSGVIHTGIAVNDVDVVVWALDQLMQALNMDTDRQIGSIPELAALCTDVGKRLVEEDDRTNGKRLLEAALALDDTCTQAYLVSSDLEVSEKRTQEALRLLEKALMCGAPLEAVESRMKVIEKNTG